MPEGKAVKTSKPVWKRWWFWVIVVLLVIIAATSNGDEEPVAIVAEPEQVEKAEPEPDPEPEPEREPESLEEFALWVVEEEVGNETNRSEYPDRVIDTNVGIDNVVLHLVSDDNLTVNMVRSGILRDSLKLFERIYGYEHVDIFVVNLVWYAPLTDKYGNESLGQIVDVGIYDDTAAKVNWDNVLFRNLPDIADYYTEHPALGN